MEICLLHVSSVEIYDLQRETKIQLKKMALKLPNFDSRSLDSLYDKAGLPTKHTIWRCDGEQLGPEVPRYTADLASMISFGKPPMTDISIHDFGGASLVTDAREHCHTPLMNHASEVLLGENRGLFRERGYRDKGTITVPSYYQIL